jgi:glycosyltransferase involved in cell wall biosynthesis
MTDTDPDNNPLVSVIIPVYNGERYLPETIESVIGQTVKDWEIVAVNDGSTDQSKAILEEFATRNPGLIRVISVQNGGVSRARNTGVSEARGTYIAFLDQDDLWMPEKLQLQLEQFRSDNTLGISFTNESVIDHNGSMVRENVLTFNGKRNRGYVFEYLVFEDFIPISSVMLKRELFTGIGGFDPRYSLAEDYDFLLKAVRETRVDYIDAPLLLYRQHSGSGTYKKIDQITRESFSVLHSWKAKDPWFFRKHCFHYFLFWLKFKILKLKISLKKG